MIESLEFTQKELEDFTREIRKVSDENASFDLQLCELSADAAEVTQNLKKATDRADYMEDQSGRNNLLICGFPEEKNENWQHFNVKPDLERTHKVEKQDRPHGVVVKFTCLQDRRKLTETIICVVRLATLRSRPIRCLPTIQAGEAGSSICSRFT